jgi:hypothetical protein
MITNKPFESSTNLVDQAAESADRAIKSTQRVANDALDSLSSSVHDVRDRASPALHRSSEQLAALAQRGVDADRRRHRGCADGAGWSADTVAHPLTALQQPRPGAGLLSPGPPRCTPC